MLGGEADTLFEFKGVCELWGVPLAEDKTIEPTEVLTFLGVEFDTRDMIWNVMKANKVTLRDLQSLIGLLNFACLAIAPGRTFIRRLIDATCNVNKPHHKVTKAIKEDIKAWLTFLTDYNEVTVMLDNLWTSNETIELYTDSAGGQIGVLAYIFRENGFRRVDQRTG